MDPFELQKLKEEMQPETRLELRDKFPTQRDYLNYLETKAMVKRGELEEHVLRALERRYGIR